LKYYNTLCAVLGVHCLCWTVGARRTDSSGAHSSRWCGGVGPLCAVVASGAGPSDCQQTGALTIVASRTLCAVRGRSQAEGGTVCASRAVLEHDTGAFWTVVALGTVHGGDAISAVVASGAVGAYSSPSVGGVGAIWAGNGHISAFWTVVANGAGVSCGSIIRRGRLSSRVAIVARSAWGCGLNETRGSTVEASIAGWTLVAGRQAGAVGLGTSGAVGGNRGACQTVLPFRTGRPGHPICGRGSG